MTLSEMVAMVTKDWIAECRIGSGNSNSTDSAKHEGSEQKHKVTQGSWTEKVTSEGKHWD